MEDGEAEQRQRRGDGERPQRAVLPAGERAEEAGAEDARPEAEALDRRPEEDERGDEEDDGRARAPARCRLRRPRR